MDSHVDMRAFEESNDPDGPAKEDDKGLNAFLGRNGATWSSSNEPPSVMTYISEP